MLAIEASELGGPVMSETRIDYPRRSRSDIQPL
jgi:hypothetical protein